MSVNLFGDLAKLLKEEQERKLVENQMLDKISHFVESLQVVKTEEIQEEIKEEILLDIEDVKLNIEDIVNQVKEQAIREIKEQSLDLFGTSSSAKTEDPLTPFDQKFATKEDLQKHYTQFLTRIQQQLASIGGGGEVKFRYLDDVNRNTMTSSNDNWVLEYDATTGKAQFTNQIGPIEWVRFDRTHVHQEERVPGTLCWSEEDFTLNLEHPNGVTQQVGQDLFGYARNQTGNTIPIGTVVGFVGAEQNGTARLLIGPYVADGTSPSLYIFGVADEDIADGADGHVTVWGKVRGLDMSAFSIGDILYVSTTEAGKFTNVKPTAPNNVIPIAAVLNNSNTAGEIFVRPTINQQQSYGRFARTTDQTANTVNTAYPILFNDTEISNGITIGNTTSHIIVNQSGFYQFDVSLQVSASSNKGIVYVWYKKNNNDIPYSSRRATITNNDTLTFNSSLQISLNANDYIEIIWATDAAGITLDANPTPTVGPAVASVILSVGQIQL